MIYEFAHLGCNKFQIYGDTAGYEPINKMCDLISGVDKDIGYLLSRWNVCPEWPDHIAFGDLNKIEV